MRVVVRPVCMSRVSILIFFVPRWGPLRRVRVAMDTLNQEKIKYYYDLLLSSNLLRGTISSLGDVLPEGRLLIVFHHVGHQLALLSSVEGVVSFCWLNGWSLLFAAHFIQVTVGTQLGWYQLGWYFLVSTNCDLYKLGFKQQTSSIQSTEADQTLYRRRASNNHVRRGILGHLCPEQLQAVHHPEDWWHQEAG